MSLFYSTHELIVVFNYFTCSNFIPYLYRIQVTYSSDFPINNKGRARSENHWIHSIYPTFLLCKQFVNLAWKWLHFHWANIPKIYLRKTNRKISTENVTFDEIARLVKEYVLAILYPHNFLPIDPLKMKTNSYTNLCREVEMASFIIEWNLYGEFSILK